MPGPHEAISAEYMRERSTERQIRQIYRESPIERRGTARGKPVSYYYAPTSEQQTEMIELIKTLPPEKQVKYVSEPIVEEPAPESKGLGEQLASITYADITTGVASGVLRLFGVEESKIEQKMEIAKPYATILQPRVVTTGKPMPIFGEPVQTIGGVVASAEAPAYTIGRLVGVKTPRPPPGVISGTISGVLGDPGELGAIEKLGPSYAVGTVMGDIMLSYVTGKGISKAWTGAKQIPKLGLIPQKAEQLYIKGIQKLPGPLQRLFISEEVISRRPTAIARQRYLSMKMGKFGYTRTPSVSVRAGSWASQTKFTSGIVHTPFEKSFGPSIREVSTRSGSLLLTQRQVSRTVTQQVTKQLTFRMMVKPATAQITRQILKTTVTQAPKLVSPTTIPMLTWIGKQFPHYKVDQPPMAKLLPVTKQYPKQKQKDKQVPVLLHKTFEKTRTAQDLKLRVDQIQIPGLQQAQIIKTIQIQVQISPQLVALKMAKPLRILTTAIRVGPQRRIKRRKKRKRRKDPFGRWFPKTHPIPDPEEMIRRVGL